jgi:hypothetical protein
MNTKIMLGSLSGAVLIYAVLAACSGNKGANAQAAPTPVQVIVANCDQTFQSPGPCSPLAGPSADGGPCYTTIYYAEASFPGLSAQQLAGHVTNWTTPVAGDPSMPSGYTLRGQDAIYTKDGTVGAGCAQGTTSTFIYAP